MPAIEREKFATQVNPQILAEARALAQTEGRLIDALVDEALADLIKKRKGTNPRTDAMAAYVKSLEKYNELYRRLAN